MRSTHIVLAEFEKRILAEMGLETKFNIQEITMLLFLIQAGRRSLVGRVIVPSTKPILFFTESPMVIAPRDVILLSQLFRDKYQVRIIVVMKEIRIQISLVMIERGLGRGIILIRIGIFLVFPRGV